MSLLHQALHGLVASLRPRLLGSSSLKIIGAFVGGIACTGVVVAAWNGSLGSLGSIADQRERPQFAAAAPAAALATISAKQTAAPKEASKHATQDAKPLESRQARQEATPPENQPSNEENKQPETTGSTLAESAFSSSIDKATPEAVIANRDGCENQTWPYIHPHCLTKAVSETAGSPQRIRIVSTDTTIASDRTPVPQSPAAPQPPASGSTSATELNTVPTPSASAPIPQSDPRKAGRDPTRQAANAPAAWPPQPQQSQMQTGIIASTPTNVSGNPQRAEEPPAPEIRPRAKYAKSAASKKRQPRADARRTQQRLEASVQPYDDGLEQRNEGSVHPRQNGRLVTIEQIYRMPNGRRVVVRRVYRGMQDNDVRELRDFPASPRRAPFGRYQAQTQPELIADD